MSQSKRQFTGSQKVHILRHHLLDKTPVSDVCTQYGIHPTLFYRWQKEFFEKGSSVFSHKMNHIHAARRHLWAVGVRRPDAQDRQD